MDIVVTFATAMNQAELTADVYLKRACDILDALDVHKDWSIADAVELCKVMAQDFHTCVTGMKLQEIRDALREISDAS